MRADRLESRPPLATGIGGVLGSHAFDGMVVICLESVPQRTDVRYHRHPQC